MSPLVNYKATFAEITGGNLNVKIDTTSRDEIGQLSAIVNTFAEKLKTLIGSIKDTSMDLASSSDEMSATTMTFSNNAQSQAATAEEITATIEELSAGMDHIATDANNQFDNLNLLISSIGQLTEMVNAMGNKIQNALLMTEDIATRAQ